MSVEEKKTRKEKKMIPLMMPGTMACIKAGSAGLPIVPAISPNIQGSKAYELLTDQQKGMLKFALRDYAKKHKCSVSDLEWSFCRIKHKNKRRNAMPLSIKKRIKIDVERIKNAR